MSDETAGNADRVSRPTVIGHVISNKMQKTIVVREDRKVLHPLYKKYVRRATRYVAHDEAGTAREGDVVEISQTRPISKTKRWRLVRVVRAAPTSVAGAPAESAQ